MAVAKNTRGICSMSDLKKLVNERDQLKEQLMTVRKMLDQQAKKRLEVEGELKELKQSLSGEERRLTNPFAMRAHIERLSAQLRAHTTLNDTLREQRDLWIHKFNHTREPKFDFNYLMRVCEAIAK